MRVFRQRAWRTAIALGFGLLVAAASIPDRLHGETPASIEVGKFSSALEGASLPADWQLLTFKKIPRHTTYDVVKDNDRLVVRAVSHASSAGLTREIKLDPHVYPVVEWRWKVANVLKKGDVSKKEGDDYPARLYITFEYDSNRVNFFKKAQYEAVRLLYGRYPPLGAITYIWESRAPAGTVVPNPYTDQVMMFVVETGETKLNTWVTERRNVYEDYLKAFGMDPPWVSGVAIATDTDNTGESATAYYGDIVFLKK